MQLHDSQLLVLSDYILQSFKSLHFGAFGGSLARILYIFVRLAPIALIRQTLYVPLSLFYTIKTTQLEIRLLAFLDLRETIVFLGTPS